MPGEAITVLHLSDPQFGRNHLFGSSGLTVDDQHLDSLFARLHEDLRGLAESDGLRPDLVVVSGDLAEWGRPSEFEQVREFLEQLAAALELPRRRVLVVPGNHDISRADCQAYFLSCEASEQEPVAPFWPKWKHFKAMFDRFYADEKAISFDVDQPWTLFELPDLRLVVAGLNSTMVESHRDEDHYGWVGEAQLRWFADRLRRFEEQGWLRVAVLHHNVIRGATADDENLRDAPDLEAILAPHLSLVLHGHTHDAKLHRLGRGLPVLSTGSAAVVKDARPAEVPNQYQFVRVHADRVERWARCYQPDQKRWVGDTRISADGGSWHDQQEERLERVHGTFPSAAPDPARVRAREPELDPRREGDDFLSRVAEVCLLRNPGATVTRRAAPSSPPLPYLRVGVREDGLARQYPVGACEQGVTPDDLERFARHVHDTFRPADPLVVSELVYGGDPADPQLVQAAWRRGVRLVSFMEYQGILDLRGYVAKQTTRLRGDRIYPPHLYVPQRYRLLDADDGPRADLLAQVMAWIDAPQGRFILVLGDFGRGKTFLLHELARRIPEQLPHLVPVLVPLGALEKARGLDELVAQHLAAAGEERFDLQAFRYMLREGRVVLLFDGFDELAQRVTYDRAADHLETLLQAAEGRAKVVVSSRTQHFRSDEQVTTALGARVELLPGRRLVAIEDFDDDQILAFLGMLYGGDQKKAKARFDLLSDVRDLLGLSRNPRMLTFIADLPDEQLLQARDQRGEITSADLYRLLLDRWIQHEQRRAQPKGTAPHLEIEERWEAVTRLALRLWQTTDRTVGLADLASTVTETLGRLAERRIDPAQATHAIGSGTLLVRSEEGQFAFVHQSVMEWLVAKHAAGAVGAGEQSPDVLGARKMSPLMADFFRGLLGDDAARDWAASVLDVPSSTDTVKANALLVLDRLGEQRAADSQLAGQDLRGASLSGRDLRRADLREADLSDARLDGANLTGASLSGAKLRGALLNGADLTGADLTGADLTGARLLGADLRNARLAGSVLRRAALIGARLDASAFAALEAPGAALPGAATEPQLLPSFAGTGLAFSPDGELLSVSGLGGLVWIVDVESREPLRALRGHTGQVQAVSFDATGRQLATGDRDGAVRVWNPFTGRERHTLERHLGDVNGVAFHPGGRQLASAGDDGYVLLWDATSGRQLHILESHQSAVNGVAFHPGGRQLASAGGDGTVRLWDPSSGRELHTLHGHQSAVNGVAFHPDGRQLASAGGDGYVLVWDATSGRELHSLHGHLGAVVGAAFHPGGQQLATAGDDGSVLLWDLTSGQELHTLQGHQRPINSLAFHPGGQQVATGHGDRIVRLWDVASGQELHALHGHQGTVYGVAFHPDGRQLATAGGDGTVRVWDPTSGQELHTLHGRQGPIYGVAFHPGGRQLATGDGGAVRVWDLTSGQELHTLHGHHGAVNGVAFSPDGRQLASAGSDRTVRLWHPASGRELHTLHGHGDWLWGVAFSPDGRQLATASSDGTVRVWDPTRGQELHALHGHQGLVLGVAFSPDGRLLASASNDGTVRVWDPISGRAGHTLQSHRGLVFSVAFSPDGGRLASGGSDGSVQLWDPQMGTWLATLVPLKEGWAVLLPDGRYKLAGQAGGELWWVAGLCRFEPGELDPYVPSIRRLPADAPLFPAGG